MRWLLKRWWFWAGTGFMLVVVCAGIYWLVSETSGARVNRSFPAAGVKRVILRGRTAGAAEVIAVPDTEVVEVSGVPVGGAQGYHSSDPNWRETPAAKRGLDFVSAHHGDVLVISTEKEIHFIHHDYFLQSIVLRVPAGVEVVRERRTPTGDGAPDLREPGP